jgi:streptomycin 6-kinase
MTFAEALPGIVLRRAESLGAEGLAWIASLDAEVAALAEEWAITTGAVLSDGSEALVVEAMLPDGRPAILKFGLPGSESGRQEANVLLSANGKGYATLYRHDYTRRAMLLERLGPSLDSLGLPVQEQLEILCRVLREAWHQPPPGTTWTTGAEKAVDLAAFISGLWEELGRPCSERCLEAALIHARRRAAAFDPERSVLAHGDPHAANALLVPGTARHFKFIDPDGLFIEPGYDLGVLMRGWGEPLLAGDAPALGRARARQLAALTGVDEAPIWEWGFVERVSTGLLLLQLGEESTAATYLAVAEAYAGAPV